MPSRQTFPPAYRRPTATLQRCALQGGGEAGPQPTVCPTTTTTTTIISEGADPLRPAWGHPTEGQALRVSPEYVWLLPVSGSPNPRFPPYVVRTLHVHGALAYGEGTPLEVKMKPRTCQGKVRRASLGDLGGPKVPPADPFRSPWASLGSKWPRGRSKRPNRIERRRAPNVTHSVVWRTCVPRSI